MVVLQLEVASNTPVPKGSIVADLDILIHVQEAGRTLITFGRELIRIAF
jgi:hypothetical protein